MESLNFRKTPVYSKALEIFKVSRIIACSVSDNKHVLEMASSEEEQERVAGEIVTDSLGLATGIAALQNSPTDSLRVKRVKKIRRSVKKILDRCRQMETPGSREREFILLLKEEIYQFEELLSDWLYTLRLNSDRN